MGKVRTIKSMILCMIIMSIIIESVFMNQCVEVRADTLLIKGYVFEAPDNNSSEGAKVEFLRDGNVVKIRYTDENGYYSFSYNIERFYIYTFQVSKYGFEPTSGGGPTYRRTREFYNFTLNAVGENQYYIYGTVTDENSNPLLNARVEFLRDGYLVTYRYTNVSGQYSFNYGDDAGPHTYELNVSKQDYQTNTTDGPTSPGYFNCDFVLKYEFFGLEIEGFVKYNSIALENATVELWKNIDTLEDSRRTDEDGYYLGWDSFDYYPIHNYELRAFHPNFTIEVQPLEVETGGLISMNFTMQDTMDRYVILLGINDFDSDGIKDDNDFSDKHLRILEWYECFREAFGIPDENFEILTDEDPDDSIFDDTNAMHYKSYQSSFVDSIKCLNESYSAATHYNTTETLQDVLWGADANDEVFICLLSHGSINDDDDFVLPLLNSDIITGTEISTIIAASYCKTEKIFVYTHACHGGKLGEILMENPKKSSIYVATGCGAEGVVIYPFQKTLVTKIWRDTFSLRFHDHASPTVAMETLFKEAIQYMYNNPNNFLMDYSYFYNTNPPYERIYTYTINGTSYYGWNQSDFILNMPDEYSLPNGYGYNCSTFALNNITKEYYFHLLDSSQNISIWFFENYTLFEELAEKEYGYLIGKNTGISITAIYIHGWEHLMPCEYDGDNQNYFING